MRTNALTPKEIVRELDKYIIGQDEAKKSVAIALRNRWRRQQLSPELRDEVAPKNIIMIGPTGIGKTEIARRLARLTHAPFIKVEASKYTEVGYIGRDVESMVRELTDLSISIVRKEKTELLKPQAEALTEERILDLLLPPGDTKPVEGSIEDESRGKRTREKLRQQLRAGKLEERTVVIEARERFMPMFEVFSGSGLEQMDININEMFGKMLPQETKRRKSTIEEAKKVIFQEEVQGLINMDDVTREAIIRVEGSGIIFIDELDKIAGRETSKGPDVSREGVQRDLLPIIEGTTVATKYGMVKTDHILFIAAGAFHVAKPSDLIPEMQGRFPIRVELKSLLQKDFEKILTQPESSLVKQYCALLATEGVKIKFLKGAIREIASIASLANKRMENIGARRLHTIMEKLLEDISFAAADAPSEIEINADYVKEKLAKIIKDEDASKYIL